LADRFDGLIEDVFELQDKVTTSVAASIEPKVRVAEIERALLKPTENLEAYDLVLRGRWAYGGQQRNPYEETAHLCRRAIALDPNYALAYALLARALWVRVAHQWVKPSQDELTECVNFARTAVRLGRAEPEVLAIAAQIIALPGGELEEAVTAYRAALEVFVPAGADYYINLCRNNLTGRRRFWPRETIISFTHIVRGRDAHR
jgi:adenylate cyclase